MVGEIVDYCVTSILPVPKVRWTEEDDVAFYKTFLDTINQFNLTTDDFKGPTNKILFEHKHVLKQLVKSSNWRGTTVTCLRRIKRILDKNGFNYRETRKLKKMLKLVKKNKMTIEQVLEHFPGRSHQMIEEFKNNLLTEH